MTQPPVCFVLDAGVALKLVLPEPLADRAAALFQLLGAQPPPEFHVPDLFYVECTNTLWKYVRRGALTEADALGDAARLGAITLRIALTAELMEDGLRLAGRHDISAYDACYLALSDWLGVTLVTADERLVRKVAGGGHKVVWMGALTLPPARPT